MGHQVSEYPRWRYHASKPAQLVQNPQEDKALGEGWADSPERVHVATIENTAVVAPLPPAPEPEAAPARRLGPYRRRDTGV